MKEVVIIGGGIAGLCTAIALKKLGVNFKVYEAASELVDAGAGLGLGANAIMALKILGLELPVVNASHVISEFKIFDSNGNCLASTDYATLSLKYGVDSVAIHRSELQKVLLNFVEVENLVLSKRAMGINRTNSFCEVSFDDGTKIAADYLIVADGVNSRIRQQLLPHSQPRYAGYTCWRSIVKDPSKSIANAAEIWGTNGRFGIVPLANNEIYWFACVNSVKNNSGLRNYSVADLKRNFENYPDMVLQTLDKTSDDNVICGDILDLKPIRKFAFDNILLIGDAAHATTPNMAQGACQAIEDAAMLYSILQKEPNFVHAFKHFERKRIARTRQITERSWQIGKLAQLENRVAIFIRNLLVKHTPASSNEKRLSFLYEVDFS